MMAKLIWQSGDGHGAHRVVGARLWDQGRYIPQASVESTTTRDTLGGNIWLTAEGDHQWIARMLRDQGLLPMASWAGDALPRDVESYYRDFPVTRDDLVKWMDEVTEGDSVIYRVPDCGVVDSCEVKWMPRGSHVIAYRGAFCRALLDSDGREWSWDEENEELVEECLRRLNAV